MNKLKILLVGCGKMGSALLEGWVDAGVKPENITVVEPNPSVEITKNKKIKVLADSSDVGENYDFCIFAVKPQVFNETVKNYNFLNNDKCVFISIAAGKNIKTMENLLGANAPIIRAMPNLPATVSAGITAICSNKNVSEKGKSQAIELLNSVGEVIEIKNEDSMDAITAISGSGPAYVFYLIEILHKIGAEQGLDNAAALALAKHTVSGSGELALDSSKAPSQLRTDVTSPGGTTEAALNVLMKDKKLENLFNDAIKAAINRAKELR